MGHHDAEHSLKKVLVMVKTTALPALIVVSAGDIAERAYQIYTDRGRADGFDCEDWLRAERELTAAHPPRLPTKRRGTRDRRGTTRSG